MKKLYWLSLLSFIHLFFSPYPARSERIQWNWSSPLIPDKNEVNYQGKIVKIPLDQLDSQVSNFRQKCTNSGGELRLRMRQEKINTADWMCEFLPENNGQEIKIFQESDSTQSCQTKEATNFPVWIYCGGNLFLGEKGSEKTIILVGTGGEGGIIGINKGDYLGIIPDGSGWCRATGFFANCLTPDWLK